MADGYEGDITGHPSSAKLFTAWQTADPATRRKLIEGMPPPGAVALRSRYRHLLDPKAPPGPWDAGLSLESWHRLIELENDGDRAIHRNDGAEARKIFVELLEREPSTSHRVVTVHAHVGQGDIALADGDAENAGRGYEAALAVAREDGYRFGQLRALVGLGYVTLMFHSAGTALERFREASALATALNDVLYASNSLLGIAECEERVGALDQAAIHAEEAHLGFAGLGSAIGVGNAAQRLAAVLHRLGRHAEARDWYGRAHAAFVEAGNPMGLTNVLSGLGDLLLEDERDLDAAERFYAESLRVAAAAELPLSRAHALQDLARVMRARHDWAAALTGFGTALAAYRELDDVIGTTNALDKLAEMHGELGHDAEALQARMEAIFSIEEYRATHRDERSQREYRDRFGRVYARALDAAAHHGSAGSFAVVADCLAGRRLAGLFTETAKTVGRDELTLLQELLVRSDQRLVEHRRGTGETAGQETSQGRRERIIRLLGAVGIRHGLADQTETSLDDLLATVYLPPADEGDALLAALPADCHVLETLLDPQDGELLRWMWRAPDGTVRIGSTALSAQAAGLIALLQSDGDERVGLRISDLESLRDLLPQELGAQLRGDGPHRLVIVPVGELWLVPWSAIPVGGHRVLGEVAAYALCPSLTVQRQLAGRRAPGPLNGPRRVNLWRSPFVRNHELASFQADSAWEVTEIGSPAEARRCLREGGGDAMVVTGHGRPAPGLGHYLELARDEWLLPVDLVGASPPRRLCMIACWGGAIPGRGPTDPLSLATLALAAGSMEIMATVGELADSTPASYYVERVLAGLAEMSLPEALCAATGWMLEDEAVRHERVHHWAPLVPIGTLY